MSEVTSWCRDALKTPQLCKRACLPPIAYATVSQSFPPHPTPGSSSFFFLILAACHAFLSLVLSRIRLRLLVPSLSLLSRRLPLRMAPKKLIPGPALSGEQIYSYPPSMSTRLVVIEWLNNHANDNITGELLVELQGLLASCQSEGRFMPSTWFLLSRAKLCGDPDNAQLIRGIPGSVGLTEKFSTFNDFFRLDSGQARKLYDTDLDSLLFSFTTSAYVGTGCAGDINKKSTKICGRCANVRSQKAHQQCVQAVYTDASERDWLLHGGVCMNCLRGGQAACCSFRRTAPLPRSVKTLTPRSSLFEEISAVDPAAILNNVLDSPAKSTRSRLRAAPPSRDGSPTPTARRSLRPRPRSRPIVIDSSSEEDSDKENASEDDADGTSGAGLEDTVGNGESSGIVESSDVTEQSSAALEELVEEDIEADSPAIVMGGTLNATQEYGECAAIDEEMEDVAAGFLGAHGDGDWGNDDASMGGFDADVPGSPSPSLRRVRGDRESGHFEGCSDTEMHDAGACAEDFFREFFDDADAGTVADLGALVQSGELSESFSRAALVQRSSGGGSGQGENADPDATASKAPSPGGHEEDAGGIGGLLKKQLRRFWER